MSEWSCEREERAASVLVTAGRDLALQQSTARPGRAPDPSSRAGRPGERIPTRPVFGTPFGLSAVPRFVHVIAGTIALNGTPATAAFQTSPPPSERPKAPIWVSETSLRRGEPVEEVLRVLHVPRSVEPELAAGGAGAAGVAGERRRSRTAPAREPIGSMSACDCAEPVEEDDSGPAAGRSGAARDEVGARERRRVRGVDRDRGPAGGRGRSAPGAHERRGDDGEDDPRPTHERHASAHLRCSPWIRGP